MKTVCVLFGGTSSEHEVSRMSATSILSQIRRDRWEVVTCGITKDGRWLLYTGPVEKILDGSWQDGGHTEPAVLSPDRGHAGLLVCGRDGIRTVPVDVVFPALHGKCGEDGTVQGLLELAGIPYVGSGVLASALCMDKAVAHVLLTHAGIPKTELVDVARVQATHFEAVRQKLEARLRYPFFVKPANAGSSVGVSRVEGPEDLAAAMELAFAHDEKIVVEQAVQNAREIECSVMGNQAPIVSSVLGEIVPKAAFYDYDAKYVDDSTELIVPAELPAETVEEIRRIALGAYRTLGCAGLCRVDFFLTQDGKVILNELNTIPGFTVISMFPKLFEHSGIAYGDLIDELIGYALARRVG